MMTTANWDREALLTLNSLVGDGLPHVWELANNALFRGFPIFLALVSLWFSGDCIKRRSRMLVGLFAVCLATLLSVWTQFHVDVHTRPLLDPELHLKIADQYRSLVWDRQSSFPSDTATLYFALTTVILLENPLVGFLCFLWTVVIIAVPRVIFGWHYPSDLIGSLFLGPGSVLVSNRIPYLRMLVERLLILFERRIYLVHALLFVFLAEAFNLFGSLQAAGRSLLRLLK